MNKCRLILVALMSLFVGCATTRRGDQPQFAPLNLQQATVYLMDNLGGITIGGRRESVVVNGVPIGTLGVREYTWFFAPPGVLEISIGDPEVPNGTAISRRFVVEPGKPYYIAYQRVRYERLEIPDGKTYEPVIARATTFKARDIVRIRESDGIAMTQTHRLVDNSAPWNPTGPGYYMHRRWHRGHEVRRLVIDYKQ